MMSGITPSNKNISYSIFSVLIMLLVAVACTWWMTRNYYDHTEETKRAFRMLDSSLADANEICRRINVEDSIKMQNDTRNPATQEMAKRWMPFINKAVALNNTIQIYLETVKQQLKEEAEMEAFDGKHDRSINGYHMNDEERRSLFDSLAAFSKSIALILPENSRKTITKLPLQSAMASFKNADEWYNHYFKGLSAYGEVAMLTKFEHDAFRSTNQITEIVNYQIGCNMLVYDVSDVLINQNTNCLLPGQSLEITAGLGMYSTTTKPIIVMDGKKQELNADGVALYRKQITSGKDDSIPVSISVTDPATGAVKSKMATVYYTVLQPPVE